MQNQVEFDKPMNQLPLKRERLPYAAVPLEPLQAVYPGDEGMKYSNASQHHIAERLEENFAQAFADGLIQDDHRTKGIYEFVEHSLFDAQNRRINFNNAHHLPKYLYPTEEYVNAALEGTATPEEILRLMLVHDIPSIEIAKQSHPFDFEATRDMNTAVLEAAIDHGFTITLNGNYRYKHKRLDRILSSMIIVRKNVFASKVVGDEIVEIVRRESLLLLDGSNCDLVNHFTLATDAEVLGDDKESRERYGAKADELLSEWSLFLDTMLDSPDKDEFDWLFPTTTSFYVRRRPIDVAE